MKSTRRQFICDLFTVILGTTIVKNTLASPPSIGTVVIPRKSNPEKSSKPEALMCLNKLPDIVVYTPTGIERRLSSYYGEPLIVNVWASYCKPCLEEIPAFNQLAKKYHVLGICDDPMITTPESLSDLLQRLPTRMTYPNVYITQDTDQSLNNCYKNMYQDVLVFPSTFLLESDGKIHAHWRGKLDTQAITK